MTLHDNQCLQPFRSKQIVARRRVYGRSAFTLVELLVVIAIIGIMVAMGLPAVQASRESSRRTECTSNLARLLLAVHSYQSAHEVLPPGTLDAQGPIRSEPLGFHHNWISQSLPYLDEMNVFHHMDHSQSVYVPANAAARQLTLAVLRCPSEVNDSLSNVGVSCYAGSHHDVEAPIDVDNRGVFFLNSRLRDEGVRDGLAHTIFLAEKRIDPDDLGWMSGTRATLRNTGTVINNAQSAAMSPTPSAAARNEPEDGANAPHAPNATPPGERASEAADQAPEKVLAGAAGSQEGQPSAAPAAQPPATAVAIDPLYVGGFGSAHPLQANFAFGDGNVRMLSTSIDPVVFRQLANRADGKPVNALER